MVENVITIPTKVGRSDQMLFDRLLRPDKSGLAMTCLFIHKSHKRHYHNRTLHSARVPETVKFQVCHSIT